MDVPCLKIKTPWGLQLPSTFNVEHETGEVSPKPLSTKPSCTSTLGASHQRSKCLDQSHVWTLPAETVANSDKLWLQHLNKHLDVSNNYKFNLESVEPYTLLTVLETRAHCTRNDVLGQSLWKITLLHSSLHPASTQRYRCWPNSKIRDADENKKCWALGKFRIGNLAKFVYLMIFSCEIWDESGC